MLYLDHAATTPMRPEVREAMAPFFAEAFGNPSGLHAVSRRAKNAIEDARERAAELLGAARPLDVVFTGGGTEADNLGVAGPVLPVRGSGVVTSAVEHEAVLETAHFLERLGHPVTIVGVDSNGVVDPVRVAEAVDGNTRLVSVMSANNETGVLQPVAEIAAAVRTANPDTLVHSDAVQAFVSRPVTVTGLGVDLISLASHKVGGPKGVGILVVPEGVALEPIVHGGGQELGRRSGTHDVAGIIGMVTALEAAASDRERMQAAVSAARDGFEERVTAGVGAIVTGAGADRLVQHSHLRIPGIGAETMVIRLDQAGVAISAGSACASGAVEVSHVLAAMGMDSDDAAECLRFSFGWTSQPEDGAAAAGAVVEVVGQLQ